MAVDSVPVHCGGCQAGLEEDPHAPSEQRHPCPNCGSLLRRFDKSDMSGTLPFYSKHEGKARHSGEKQPFMEQIIGDDLHRKSGRWMKLYRLIDRTAKKWYYKRIVDPMTGRVVHECSEPLTEHRGHGSAKNVSK